MVRRELVDSLGGHAEEFGRLRRGDQRRQRRPFFPCVEHVLADGFQAYYWSFRKSGLGRLASIISDPPSAADRAYSAWIRAASRTAGFRLAVLACSLMGPRVRA
jgi:hypothetical protein